MSETNSKQHKWALTLILAFCSFAYGLNYTLLGQTVDELQRILHSSAAKMSYVFTMKSAVYCCDAWIFQYTNRQLIHGINCLIISVFTVITATFPNYAIVLCSQSVIGFAAGGIDVATSVLVLEMWESSANMYLQCVFLGYTFGATLSPLISNAFINENSIIPNNISNSSAAIYDPNESKILLPYTITASVAFIAFVLIYFFEICEPYKTPERSISRKNTNQEINGNISETATLVKKKLPNSYYARSNVINLYRN
ncbi:sodium-dependent glucose transporter 1-like protein [Leptotrombidium deliense]|uniref:Sodium-dependent glucose transporter 1-like protein n=1 Tax=Leptotrombidium deliense TaxID=299467 RepID=A0A443SD30_9ACAR|nr:sodium-dependent glucose transporter 1-like protein [Leptotrombidium deliense]